MERQNPGCDYLYQLPALSELFDSIYNGVIIIDNRERVVIFNQTARNIFGITRQNITGCNIRDVLPGSQLPGVLESEEARTGVKVRIGDTIVLSNQSPIKIDGRLIGAISVFQDISDFEQVSHELDTVRDMAAELNAVFENSYDGIYVTDATGKTLRVNKAYERITGLPLDQLIGRNIKDIVRDGLISESITFKILKQKKALTMMQTISTGKEILVTGTPILNDRGEISKVVTNVRDMTELNNLYKQLERSRELNERYQRELSELRVKYEGSCRVIAQSKDMQNVLELARRVAAVDTTVLILGESGVGKEIVAELIHNYSPRARAGEFIKINCGAIPENLLESELFGYDEGAFTGTKRGGKAGLFEIAHGGTLFLDEIADLPLKLQGKLLRVLQEGEILRVGGTKVRHVDVRIISATNKDLGRMVQKGLYRKDLFFRLNVVPITIPPLRERKEDISGLIVHYLDHFNKKYNTGKSFSPRALQVLLDYDWPGNVRELINVVERMVVTVADDVITPGDLPDYLRQAGEEKPAGRPFSSLKEAMAAYERGLILKALQKYGTTRKTAAALQISQSALVKKAKKLGISFNKGWVPNCSGDSN